MHGAQVLDESVVTSGNIVTGQGLGATIPFAFELVRLLVGGDKRLMITGRIQTKTDSDVIYDYTGVLYPEGMISSDDMYFFNRDAISRVFFIGFQDFEEIEFQNQILSKLGELEVKDGEIVAKQAE